jgi:bifunctional DNase/RNase
VKRLEVVGVRVEVPSNQPIVLLREIGGERFLPIWIGAVEATAIAFASGGVTPPRPLTHDLFKDVVDALGATLTAVELTELKEGVFYAELVFATTTGECRVSARPSDSIALAIRTGSPIFGSEELLAEAGIEIAEQAEDEVEKFREFLDQVNPDDFLG